MKIRNGFVSNSSSSSFLVAFPRNPKNLEDVQDMVFGIEKHFSQPYSDFDGWPADYTAEEISQVIWDGVKKQIPNNRNIVLSAMHNVYDDYKAFEIPAKNPQYPGDYDYDYKGFEEANNKIVLDFMDTHKGCFFYCFEYSDNGEGHRGCAMEHGDLFHNLPHLVSSNH